MLEPMLCCRVAVPAPKSAVDFRLWGLDVHGYWNSDANPQEWTRSVNAFSTYELERLEIFAAIARGYGPLWRLHTWEMCSPPPRACGQDIWALYGCEWCWAIVAAEEDYFHAGRHLACKPNPGEAGRGVYVNWVLDAAREVTQRSRFRLPLENTHTMRDEEIVLASTALLGGAEGAKASHFATENDDPRAVFISNLPPDCSVSEVTNALRSFGPLVEVRLAGSGRGPLARRTGRGCGWAVFQDSLAAERACAYGAESQQNDEKSAVEVDGLRLHISPHRCGRQHWSKWRHTAAPGWRMQKCAGCLFAVTGVTKQFCCKMCEKENGRHGPSCRRLSWRATHRPRSLSC